MSSWIVWLIVAAVLGVAELLTTTLAFGLIAVAAVVAAVLFSLMVSYTRARAEALGVACKVGLATRPVRVVILSVGLVFAKGASLGHFELLAPAVYVLAGLSVVTTVQRIVHVRGELNAAAQV